MMSTSLSLRERGNDSYKVGTRNRDHSRLGECGRNGIRYTGLVFEADQLGNRKTTDCDRLRDTDDGLCALCWLARAGRSSSNWDTAILRSPCNIGCAHGWSI